SELTLPACPLSLRHTSPVLPPSAGTATVGYRSAKYSPAEWFSNYHSILQQACDHRVRARSVQRESKTLKQDGEADTQQSQADGTRHLGARLQDIHLLKSELQRSIEQLMADTHALMALKKRLEKALDATQIPYAIATDNLNCRTRRPPADLVRDSVEDELLKEVDLIRSVQALLKRTTAQVASQIAMNREAKQTLELDWSDKQQAYGLDERGGGYSNMSLDTQHHPGSASMQEHASWAEFTQVNLSKAQHEHQTTQSLRALAEGILQDTTEDLRVQCSRVDQAFSRRCEELVEAKTQLEVKLAQILEQIGDQETNIVSLEQAVHNKEAPLRVAQSRLYLRSLRPNMELCRDQAQLRYLHLRYLLFPVSPLLMSFLLASLEQQLREARSSLSRLEESRVALEKDINCKTHSLFIERDKCTAQRRRYPPVSVLSGY
uniref:Tektin n=1 Tax=Takifugu rubripes TaxID=31033 RepID=H2SQQ8_TAKRU